MATAREQTEFAAQERSRRWRPPHADPLDAVLTPSERLAVLQDRADSLFPIRAKFDSEVLEILKLPILRRVGFIIVGDVSAVLHTAPVTTFDPDLVHAREPQNIARLLSALAELEAVYRVQPEGSVA